MFFTSNAIFVAIKILIYIRYFDDLWCSWNFIGKQKNVIFLFVDWMEILWIMMRFKTTEIFFFIEAL